MSLSSFQQVLLLQPSCGLALEGQPLFDLTKVCICRIEIALSHMMMLTFPPNANVPIVPRSNAHARLRPCTIKYGRRDRILPYLTEYLAQYNDRSSPCRLRRDTTISGYKRSLFLKHHYIRSPCNLSRIGRIRSKTTSYSVSSGSYTNMNDRIRHGELRP